MVRRIVDRWFSALGIDRVVMNETSLPPLPASALFVLASAGLTDSYVYRYADDRWWLRKDGLEYWLFDGIEGIRIVDNPF